MWSEAPPAASNPEPSQPCASLDAAGPAAAAAWGRPAPPTAPGTAGCLARFSCVLAPGQRACSIRAGWAAERALATRAHAAGCLYWLARSGAGAEAVAAGGAVQRLAQLLRDATAGMTAAPPAAEAPADGA